MSLHMVLISNINISLEKNRLEQCREAGPEIRFRVITLQLQKQGLEEDGGVGIDSCRTIPTPCGPVGPLSLAVIHQKVIYFTFAQSLTFIEGS